MNVNVVALDPDNRPVFRTSRGPHTTQERGAFGERNKIVSVGLVYVPCCAACDLPLTNEERRDPPQMYEDLLCKRCFEWVGRTIVRWLGSDEPATLELTDPFWINELQS